MRWRRFSLATIVASTLVLVITVVLVVYSIITYRADAARQRRDLQRLMFRQVNEVAVALALPVWNIDRLQIDRVIEATAQPGSVYAISATAAGRTHGVIRDANWKLVPWDGKHEPAGMLIEEAPIMLSDKIGNVRLLATWRFVEKDLRAERMRIVVSISAMDVLLILLIYVLLYRNVVHPLKQIEHYAVAMSGGGNEPPAPLGPRAAAELLSLRSSLETMIRLLDQRYVELQQEAVRRFESEERFRTIFDSVNDAIFIHDVDSGAILDVNARMCEMFGYTREEALRLDIGALASREDPQRPMEWQARTKDGRTFWIEINRRTAMIGGAPRMLVVARDVTQRREMEEALRRSETMSMMGSLVAGVAHEVRNPLFGIAATVDAFEAEFGSGEGAAEYMMVLRNDVGRLSRLMHDLLEYGRPQRIEPHMQSIEPVVAEAVRVCTPRAKERQIEIRQQLAGPLPLVAIDADRMLQVLKNVVENAIDFSKRGDAVLISASVDGASSIVFTISDHGPGFRGEDLPHLFEPFFTRRPGGSGLGLAIVQKIVAEHGGTIEARNAAEGGGVIEIRLPTAERR